MPVTKVLPPPVAWAQTKTDVFITFLVENCKNAEVKLDSKTVYFKGTGGTENHDYENTLELFGEVDKEKSRYSVNDRIIECMLTKKEAGPFWPRLLAQKGKVHWLKVDFQRWQDSDDEDVAESSPMDFAQGLRQFGDFNDGGGPLNLDDLNSAEDEEEEEDDSSEGDIPHLV